MTGVCLFTGAVTGVLLFTGALAGVCCYLQVLWQLSVVICRCSDRCLLLFTGAQSDSEVSSGIHTDLDQREYQSDSELYDSQSKTKQDEPRPLPSAGSWQMVSSVSIILVFSLTCLRCSYFVYLYIPD